MARRDQYAKPAACPRGIVLQGDVAADLAQSLSGGVETDTAAADFRGLFACRETGRKDELSNLVGAQRRAVGDQASLSPSAFENLEAPVCHR